MDIRGHRNGRADLSLFHASIAEHGERRLVAATQILQSLVRVCEPVATLTVGVPRQPILPAGAPMARGNRLIEIQPIAMFETNIPFVDHLHVRPTAKQYMSTEKAKGNWHSRAQPFHGSGQTAGFSLPMQ